MNREDRINAISQGVTQLIHQYYDGEGGELTDGDLRDAVDNPVQYFILKRPYGNP